MVESATETAAACEEATAARDDKNGAAPSGERSKPDSEMPGEDAVLGQWAGSTHEHHPKQRLEQQQEQQTVEQERDAEEWQAPGDRQHEQGQRQASGSHGEWRAVPVPDGDTYYYNTATRETTWELPEGCSAQPAPAPASAATGAGGAVACSAGEGSAGEGGAVEGDAAQEQVAEPPPSRHAPRWYYSDYVGVVQVCGCPPASQPVPASFAARHTPHAAAPACGVVTLRYDTLAGMHRIYPHIVYGHTHQCGHDAMHWSCLGSRLACLPCATLEQGPFTMDQLLGWRAALPMCLPVWLVDAPVDGAEAPEGQAQQTAVSTLAEARTHARPKPCPQPLLCCAEWRQCRLVCTVGLLPPLYVFVQHRCWQGGSTFAVQWPCCCCEGERCSAPGGS